MAVLEVVTIPNKVLLTKARKSEVDESTKELAQNLVDTLNTQINPKGAGLAAPQIGILKRVCVVKKFFPDPNNPENELESTFILINPEIITHSEATSLYWEGCLSIPDTYGQVERFKRIRVKALDVSGNEFVMKADDFFARVIQHEVDHLDGILFTYKTTGELFTEKELDELNRKREEEKFKKLKEAAIKNKDKEGTATKLKEEAKENKKLG